MIITKTLTMVEQHMREKVYEALHQVEDYLAKIDKDEYAALMTALHNNFATTSYPKDGKMVVESDYHTKWKAIYDDIVSIVLPLFPDDITSEQSKMTVGIMCEIARHEKQEWAANMLEVIIVKYRLFGKIVD